MQRRLQRLEQKVPDPGCLACSDRRGLIVLVEAERLADGSVVLRGTEPEVCAQCGIVAENVVQVFHSYMERRNRYDDVQHGNKERP
jgi:hypothetical protein